MKRVARCIVLLLALSPGRVAAGEETAEEPPTQIGAEVSAYCLYDLRIFWSGCEATFGVEADAEFTHERPYSGGTLEVAGRFHLNQPRGEKVYNIGGDREYYLARFEVDPFEIAELYFTIETPRLTWRLGKIPNPVREETGLDLFNSGLDDTFLYTEVLPRRETGLTFGQRKETWGWTLGMVNGEENLDTNSSKAGVLVFEFGRRDGARAKLFGRIQDGIGSEEMKSYANYAGAGLYLGAEGGWRVSLEAVYDHHGFRRVYDYETYGIPWPLDLYRRNHPDTYVYSAGLGRGRPIGGLGAHVSLHREGDPWQTFISYGGYHPESIGDPYHDAPTRRFVLEFRREVGEKSRVSGLVILENERPLESWQHPGFTKGIVLALAWDAAF